MNIDTATPVMVSTQGEIVCIEESKDAPTIGVPGVKGSGKSVFSAGLIGRFYHYQGYKCFMANDQHNETFTHSKPNSVAFMNRDLRFLQERPKGLPIIYVYPSTRTLQTQTGGRIIKSSVPFKEFLKNYEFWINLDKSSKYFKELVPELKSLSNEVDVMNSITQIENKNSREKIEKELQLLMSGRYFDITGDGVTKTLVGEKELPLIIGLLKNNWIVSLMTNNLQHYDKYKHIFSYYLNQIFEEQDDLSGVLGKDKDKVMLYFEEINSCQELNSTILNRMVTEGRPRRIGTVWAGQDYSKVTKKIRDNTIYTISLAQKSEEAAKIGSDHSMEKTDVTKLKNLNKYKGECMGVSKEKFLVYDPKTKSKYLDSGPFFGKYLYPLSYPKDPHTDINSFVEPLLRFPETVIKGEYLKIHPYPIQKTCAKLFCADYKTKFFIRNNLQNELLSFREFERRGGMLVNRRVLIRDRKGNLSYSRIYDIQDKKKRLPETCTVMNHLPDGVNIELHKYGKLVRVWGKNTGPRGTSEWIKF